MPNARPCTCAPLCTHNIGNDCAYNDDNTTNKDLDIDPSNPNVNFGQILGQCPNPDHPDQPRPAFVINPDLPSF